MIETYTGPFAGDLADYWVLPHRARTSELYEEAVIVKACRLQSESKHGDAAGVLEKAIATSAATEHAGEMLINWYSSNGEFEKALGLARQIKRSLAHQTQVPSRRLQAQIEQLNLILLEKMSVVPFVDETMVTLLGLAGKISVSFEEAIEKYGGAACTTEGFAAFHNPLQAFEAGRQMLMLNPDVSILLHTTVLAPEESVPRVTVQCLNRMPKSGVFGTASTVEIMKTQGFAPPAT